MFPSFAKMMNLKFVDETLENFFFDLTKESLDLRKSGVIKRNDFMQLLLELKEKGSVAVDNRDLEQEEKESLESFHTQPPAAKLGLLYLSDSFFTDYFIFLHLQMVLWEKTWCNFSSRVHKVIKTYLESNFKA